MSDKQTNQLQVILQEQNVPAEQAKSLIEAFGGPFEEAGEILANYQTIKVTDENDTATMADARQKRLALKAARTTVERNRKALKENINKQGRAIDSVARFVKEVITPAEEYLQLQEDYAKIKAAERAEARYADRVEKLSQYVDDLSVYSLRDITDEAFDALLAKAKADKEAEIAAAKKAQAEAEAAAEAERKRQAEVEAENARLKKEAEARELKEAIIRGRVNKMATIGLVFDEASNAYVMDDLSISADIVNADDDTAFDKAFAKVHEVFEARAAEHRKQQDAKEAELKAERERAEKLEREKAERDAAEAKAKAEAEDAERAALLAPDKTKLISFADAINMIRTTKLPAVKTKQAQDVVNEIEAELQKLEITIKRKAEQI